MVVSTLVYVLPEVSLLLVGVFVEKYYVSRVTCFTNTIAVFVHMASLNRVGLPLGLYTAVGLVFGIWGFYNYLAEKSTGKLYREVAFYLYNSVTVALILFSGFLQPDSILPVVVLGVVVQAGIRIVNEGAAGLIYTGSRPADVKHFIENNTVPYPNERFGMVPVRLSEFFEP